MKYARHALIAFMVLTIPSVALAQQQTRFEVSPFIGWRHGNDISDVSGIAVDLESGVAYGFMVDVKLYGNLYAEFIYSHRSTAGTLLVPPGLPEIGPVGTFDIAGNIDYYQGGLLYQWDVRSIPALKPFVVGTIGAASISSDVVDQGSTRLSFSGGGGVKYMFSRNIGVRGEYRLFSTSTNFVGRGGWCDWWGFCYTFLTNKYLYQSQFSAAIIIGF